MPLMLNDRSVPGALRRTLSARLMLASAALAWVAYLGLRTLGRQALAPSNLGDTIRRRATRPGARERSGFGKLAASLSVLSWLSIALAGRAIAFLMNHNGT